MDIPKELIFDNSTIEISFEDKESLNYTGKKILICLGIPPAGLSISVIPLLLLMAGQKKHAPGRISETTKKIQGGPVYS